MKNSNPNINNNVKYYYCSTQVLFEIIKKHKIWFCDPLKMNDYNEIFAYLNTVYRSTPKEERKDLYKYIEELDLIKKNGQSYLYVICFTESKDLLSQWIMYGDGGNGVAIGFDLDKLTKKDTHIEEIKVDYINKYDKDMSLNSKIKNKLKKLEKNKGSEKLEKYLEEFIKYKDIGFSQENEIRLIYKRSNSVKHKKNNIELRNYNELLPIEYSVHNENDIKKHIELEISIDDIKEIILGPKCRINKIDLCQFIEDGFGKPIKGKTHSIHVSNITLR